MKQSTYTLMIIFNINGSENHCYIKMFCVQGKDNMHTLLILKCALK